MEQSQWSSLYQGNPLPESGNLVKKEWLMHRYRIPPLIKATGPVTLLDAMGIPLPPANHNNPPESILDPQLDGPGNLRYRRTVVSVDSAEKETERADYTAITVWRQTLDGRHYLVDAHRERMEFPKLVERVETFARDWDADYILMESKGAGNQYIQHAATIENKSWVVVPIDPGRDGKIFRMDAVTPQFVAGKVVLPERAPWLGHLEKELLEFPGSKNDDYPDSISQYLKWARDNGVGRRGSRKLGGMTHGHKSSSKHNHEQAQRTF